MLQPLSLKPQDVAVLIKLIALRAEDWRQTDLALSLGLSQGEIAKSLSRLCKAQLLQDKRVNSSAALEYLLHGVKYSFPAEIGALTVGVPTAMSSAAHGKMVVQGDDDVYVWPSLKGNKRGQMIKPFYPKLAQAALQDTEFYELMAAIEILRIGRSRERQLAEKYLERKLKNL